MNNFYYYYVIPQLIRWSWTLSNRDKKAAVKIEENKPRLRETNQRVIKLNQAPSKANLSEYNYSEAYCWPEFWNIPKG